MTNSHNCKSDKQLSQIYLLNKLFSGKVQPSVWQNNSFMLLLIFAPKEILTLPHSEWHLLLKSEMSISPDYIMSRYHHH